MTWLLILLAMALVISPVMWLRPSAQERHAAALRGAALKTGLKIKLEVPPLHGVTHTMPAYRWHYPQDKPGPDFVLVHEEHSSAALKPFAHGWRWRQEPLRGLPEVLDMRLKRLLARLPEDALVIRSDHQALTLWWEESQTFEQFASAVEDFQALRDGLAGRPDRPDAARPFGSGPN